MNTHIGYLSLVQNMSRSLCDGHIDICVKLGNCPDSIMRRFYMTSPLILSWEDFTRLHP